MLLNLHRRVIEAVHVEHPVHADDNIMVDNLRRQDEQGHQQNRDGRDTILA